MLESLSALEARRTELLRAIANLQDMRPRSIVGAVWRCGKPTCHCAQPDDPGHGPSLRLTYKWRGRTVTEALPSPAAVRKAEQEISEFRNHQQLSRELVEISERVCRLRPVEETLTPEGKKTAAAVRQEIALEVDPLLRLIFQDRHNSSRLDLEAIEMAIQAAMDRAGAAMLAELLKFEAPPAGQRTIACTCGHQAHYQELRSKLVRTAVGKAEISRPYYLCPHFHQGQFPTDRELDIENTVFMSSLAIAVNEDAALRTLADYYRAFRGKPARHRPPGG